MAGKLHPPLGCASLLAGVRLQFQYLAEGAANVIYHAIPQDEAYVVHANCCVIRLRKDLDFTKPCIDAMWDFETRIVPLFDTMPEVLMKQQLCELRPDSITAVNRILKDMEQTPPLADLRARAGSRQGVYHPSFDKEPHGILMPNLHQTDKFRLIEFKAKWLVQSPTAPPGAIRCRTCALNAMRRFSGKAPGRGDSGFCPLDLLSTDEKILNSALAAIWSDAASLHNFTRTFQEKVQPALTHLQRLEEQFNTVGLEDFRHPEKKDFSVAMTLRDCSIFLNVHDQVSDHGSSYQGVIQDVKFADLDLKSTGGGKLEKWADIEASLIRDGWYLDGKSEPNICALGRSCAI